MIKQTPLKKILCASALALSVLSFSHVAIASETFSVAGVGQNDVLNLRTAAGSESDVVAHIPPGGSAIVLTGNKNTLGSSKWVEVTWQGITGWVNKRYLSSTSHSVGAVTRNSSSANSHVHPKNKCTNSITHSHPNGQRSHVHRYSCKANKARAQKVSNKRRVQKVSNNSANTHRHPAHRCTKSVTHSHPNGSRPHQHHYSCSRNVKLGNVPTMAQMRPKAHNVKRLDPNAHTHPANGMTRSRTHSHPNGAGQHKHKYMNTQL